MALEDELIGQRVFLEVQLFGGDEGQNTQIIAGNFSGFDILKNEPVIVLGYSWVYNLSGHRFPERKVSQERASINKLTIVPTRHVLSYSIEDEVESQKYIKKPEVQDEQK